MEQKFQAIRLRILTEKSIIGFGKYNLLTIGEILTLGHTNYLRYVYYNFESISFTDDILKKIYVIIIDEKGEIIIDRRINKPGKNLELHLEIQEYMESIVKKRCSPNNYKNKMQKGAKIAMKSRKERDKIYYSKTMMKARNNNNFHK